MLAVLGEDKSDANAVAILIKRILMRFEISVKTKGFNGCGDLRNKVARDARNFARLGIKWVVVCHDADQNNPTTIRQRIYDRFEANDAVREKVFVVVPTQEIEAWILADTASALSMLNVICNRVYHTPENIQNPKEVLVELSRDVNRKKTRYVPRIHNEKAMSEIDLRLIESRCPSFREFADFIRKLEL